MAKAKVTPDEWYIDQEGDISTTASIVGDVVCLQPAEYLHSMEWWPANAKLLAQAKNMHLLLREAVAGNEGDIENRVASDPWFSKVVEVLGAIE